MRIKEGRIKKNPAAEVDVLADFAFLSLHFIPNHPRPSPPTPEMLENHDASSGRCILRLYAR